MTATLEELERDPMILRRAIELGEALQILRNGQVAGSFMPAPITAHPVDGQALWRIAELRVWRDRVWGGRIFTDAEEREMRDAEDGMADP